MNHKIVYWVSATEIMKVKLIENNNGIFIVKLPNGCIKEVYSIHEKEEDAMEERLQWLIKWLPRFE